MAAKSKANVIWDGSGASLDISGLSETLIAKSISGGAETYEEIDLTSLDSGITQKRMSRIPNWENMTITVQNSKGLRSAISELNSIVTFTLSSPNVYAGAVGYTLSFDGQIINKGEHSFEPKTESTFDIEILLTGIDADGNESIPSY